MNETRQHATVSNLSQPNNISDLYRKKKTYAVVALAATKFEFVSSFENLSNAALTIIIEIKNAGSAPLTSLAG